MGRLFLGGHTAQPVSQVWKNLQDLRLQRHKGCSHTYPAGERQRGAEGQHPQLPVVASVSKGQELPVLPSNWPGSAHLRRGGSRPYCPPTGLQLLQLLL